MTMLLNIGSTIQDDKSNKYILDDIIGQGGFGYVYKAHRIGDNSIFAVKTTFPSFGDSSSANAFKNEIQSAAKVRGENVISYEYVHDGETFLDFPPYIIMEYANGGTLRSTLEELIKNHTMLENAVLIDFFKQLASGMEDINRVLVHRDVKPDNILKCGSTWKISDFGLAKIAVEGTRSMTFKGAGTPLYMAPEAWDFSKNTIQMDIYSMGIIFYQLATLHYPYNPSPQSNEECREAHMYRAITRVDQFNSALPQSLISLINRMLMKKANQRFASWGEILQLLDQQTEPVTAVDQIVQSAIAYKNAEDVSLQNEESAIRQKQKKKSDFCKLVLSQAENEIISLLQEFAEKYNAQYAGCEKIVLSKEKYSDERFAWEMRISQTKAITIEMEAILKENFRRNLPPDPFADLYDEPYALHRPPRTENYIPQYRQKNILAWGKVSNQKNLGFNILLIECDDLYGDWLIMQNKNNLSLLAAGKERKEPFAFELQELPKEIINVQALHSYRSEFESFNSDAFVKLINQLAFAL